MCVCVCRVYLFWRHAAVCHGAHAKSVHAPKPFRNTSSPPLHTTVPHNAAVDWHDFTIVETIDFGDDEDDSLPPPCTLKEILRAERVGALAAADEEREEAAAAAAAGEKVEMDAEERAILAEAQAAAVSV